jgi:hypothetical protein
VRRLAWLFYCTVQGRLRNSYRVLLVETKNLTGFELDRSLRVANLLPVQFDASLLN